MDLSSTKERGNDSPAPPKFRPHAQAREAECSALSATGRRPPPQRHTEPRSGEGVWGIRPPRFESIILNAIIHAPCDTREACKQTPEGVYLLGKSVSVLQYARDTERISSRARRGKANSRCWRVRWKWPPFPPLYRVVADICRPDAMRFRKTIPGIAALPPPPARIIRRRKKSFIVINRQPTCNSDVQFELTSKRLRDSSVLNCDGIA